ncbi:hypothetical protein EHO57_14085 [Leptospira langatensis]|uniref:Helix-turn-helix domain-containing protein n=1 Tax=Leptospira langatensis TaxID=2484983 RepID=A0A5R2AT84_9LEPT|nr:hypothetical protein [Leptospira langatensis]TGJ99884.1 hypothetical protein EHO57_14085 [Leptospira langatensis]
MKEKTRRIFKVERRESPYTVIENQTLRDRRVSYRGRGVLAYALSHVDYFVLNADSISHEGPEGRDAISSALRELAYFGYAELKRERNPDGTWLSYWSFFEISKKPHIIDRPSKSRRRKGVELTPSLFQDQANQAPDPEKPVTDIPCADKPPMVLPAADNQGVKEVPIKESRIEERTEIERIREEGGNVPPLLPSFKHARYQFTFPESWYKSFEQSYFQIHGSLLGTSDGELMAMQKLYDLTAGDWNEVSNKIEAFKQKRASGGKFWPLKPVTPRNIEHYWAELVPLEATTLAVPKSRVI